MQAKIHSKKDSLDVMGTYINAMENPNPKHFEMIPDVLTYLTYVIEKVVKGKKIYVRKRLTPFEKEIYRVIMRAAVSSGCWMTAEKIAFEANCSEGAVANAKKILQMPFEQLDGESLIEIEKRYLPWEDKELGFKNKKPNDFITVKNIWKYNNGFMAMFRDIDYRGTWPVGEMTQDQVEIYMNGIGQNLDVHKSGLDTSNDRAYGAGSYDEVSLGEAGSCGEVNHTHNNQTKNDRSYPPASPYNDPSNSNKLYDFMTNVGIYKPSQKKLVKKYSEKFLVQKMNELENLWFKGKVKNRGAYFRKMLSEK